LARSTSYEAPHYAVNFLNYNLFVCEFEGEAQQNILSDLNHFICPSKKLTINSVYQLLSGSMYSAWWPRCKALLYLGPHNFIFKKLDFHIIIIFLKFWEKQYKRE
jgi:hypothetical protein